MAAARDDDKAVAAHAGDERLVVEDQRIRLPALDPVGLVTREAALELGGAVDFAGDVQRALQQKRRLAVLDDVEPGALQRALAGRRQLDRLAPREGHPPAAPELGV